MPLRFTFFKYASGGDGGKWSFFGGERFIEGISGEANVMQINDLS